MKQLYARDVLLSFVLQIFENGRSFLLIPVIAKTLGASGYGIWVLVKDIKLENKDLWGWQCERMCSRI